MWVYVVPMGDGVSWKDMSPKGRIFFVTLILGMLTIAVLTLGFMVHMIGVMLTLLDPHRGMPHNSQGASSSAEIQNKGKHATASRHSARKKTPDTASTETLFQRGDNCYWIGNTALLISGRAYAPGSVLRVLGESKNHRVMVQTSDGSIATVPEGNLKTAPDSPSGKPTRINAASYPRAPAPE